MHGAEFLDAQLVQRYVIFAHIYNNNNVNSIMTFLINKYIDEC